MNPIASEAFRLCRRCNDMEAEMRQELIKMLVSKNPTRFSGWSMSRGDKSDGKTILNN